MTMSNPLRIAAALAAICFSGSASAIDYQVHGYAAQGFVLSRHNDFFGDSTDGSFDYYEAGINAAVQVQPNLTFAAQAPERTVGKLTISPDSTPTRVLERSMSRTAVPYS